MHISICNYLSCGRQFLNEIQVCYKYYSKNTIDCNEMWLHVFTYVVRYARCLNITIIFMKFYDTCNLYHKSQALTYMILYYIYIDLQDITSNVRCREVHFWLFTTTYKYTHFFLLVRSTHNLEDAKTIYKVKYPLCTSRHM